MKESSNQGRFFKLLVATCAFSAVLSIVPVASLPASAESTVDISAVEGAEFVKDKEIVAASQLEAAILAQSKGFDKEPTEFSVVQIEESTVTLANGTVLLGVETDGRGHTSIEFIPEPEVRRPTALSEASAIERCDKWDVGWSANGQMDNTWFGNSWRSERLVSMMIGMFIGIDFPNVASALHPLSKGFIKLVKTIVGPI